MGEREENQKERERTERGIRERERERERENDAENARAASVLLTEHTIPVTYSGLFINNANIIHIGTSDG